MYKCDLPVLMATCNYIRESVDSLCRDGADVQYKFNIFVVKLYTGIYGFCFK